MLLIESLKRYEFNWIFHKHRNNKITKEVYTNRGRKTAR